MNDHEVQLHSLMVRIGSMKADANGLVRVVSDKNKQEISFQFKGMFYDLQLFNVMLECIFAVLLMWDAC